MMKLDQTPSIPPDSSSRTGYQKTPQKIAESSSAAIGSSVEDCGVEAIIEFNYTGATSRAAVRGPSIGRRPL